MAGKSFVFKFADFEVSEREMRVTRAGSPLPVEPKAFRVLLCLLRNPGRLVPKDELLNAVWGETAVTENSLSRSISVLRHLLEDDPRNPRYIETVSTVGYRFIGPVELVGDSSGKPQPTLPPTGAIVDKLPSPLRGNELPVAPSKAEGAERHRSWLILGVAGVTALLAAGFWYLHRPLPPLRITESVPITLDGKQKDVVGTDGSRVYLNVLPRAIAQVPVSGGPITQVPVDLLAGEPASNDRGAGLDVSPAASSFLVRRRPDGGMYEVWVVGTQGHPARYLTRASSAAWSPDGKSVVYCTEHGDIYLIPSVGGEPRLLLSSSAPAGESLRTEDLSWSPDGSTVRFTRDNELWEVASSGTNLHPLLRGWRASAAKCCGRWTPDGEFFLFLAGNTRQHAPLFTPGSQLWAIDERRGRLHPPIAEPIQLTTGPTVWSSQVPSLDGKDIFARGITFRGELDRYDRQSNQLQPYLDGISAEFVAFSRDGKYVAYVSFPDGILWRANRDGTGLVQLSEPPFHPKLLRWSPDGSQILFTDDDPKGVNTMFVVPAQGGPPRRVLPEDNGTQSDASWSADGKELVYGSKSTFSTGPQGKWELRVLDLATRRVTTLPGSQEMGCPRWSPDGRYIAACSAQGMSVFDLESQRWTTIRNQRVNWPTWSQDSRSIYFLDTLQTLLRIPVQGGKPELVVDLKDFRHTGWFTAWMGLDPSDAPLLLRDRGTDEIYALTLERK